MVTALSALSTLTSTFLVTLWVFGSYPSTFEKSVVLSKLVVSNDAGYDLVPADNAAFPSTQDQPLSAGNAISDNFNPSL